MAAGGTSTGTQPLIRVAAIGPLPGRARRASVVVADFAVLGAYIVVCIFTGVCVRGAQAQGGGLQKMIHNTIITMRI